jgi:separase
VLEVTEALQAYHNASAKTSERGHTILILDKALHSFPWESLSCLRYHSVSRMPSLNSIQRYLSDPGRNRINAQNGAYILNPSSDLQSTQETFHGSFQSKLANYTSIVNRPPSEAEFESCLRDRELCLYFGHGSGAQFIRGRTIKRLDRCAVTFLMGCSSSKMVECGQFEPYGVPYNYLHAGSAAVVGTLWDVTDKDIDRFAMNTFVNWKLLDRDVLEEHHAKTSRAKGLKGKNKEKKGSGKPPSAQSAVVDDEREVALDEAVARARDSCLLRYLNGAAPVIYGIPVYLDR